MRFITESELRAQFAEGAPSGYTPPQGARLTPAARQYLTDLRLYRPGKPAPAAGSTTEKPEHMTSLNGRDLVLKSHPRIVLRGMLDQLEAQILLAQVACVRLGRRDIEDKLRDALLLTRKVLACDVVDMPLEDWTLGGMTSQQVRAASHDPAKYTGGGHVLPDASQGELPALLNALRAWVRQAELQAVAALCEAGTPRRPDLIEALNRMSSYFYVLQLQVIAGGER